MKKLTDIMITAAMTVALLAVWSCAQEDPVVPNEEKYCVLETEKSIVPVRVQYSKDIIYYFRVAFDTNAYTDDSLNVTSFFTLGEDTVGLDLYDDGVSDGLLRNDLAASNNIWSGGISGLSFPEEGDWVLNVQTEMTGIRTETHEPFTGIRVKTNTTPVINSVTGISDPDTLISGFPARIVNVSITDPDNDATGYNDNQSLELFISGRSSSKTYNFIRQDPLNDLVITADSTYAAGLISDRYSLRFIVTDYYDESDTLTTNRVYIENTPPVIVETVHPDTVTTTENGVMWIRSRVNDRQGHLSYQDIDRVEIEINSYVFQLLDDGEFNYSGDETENDGIYSVGFSFDAGDSGSFDISITAYDKAGNLSPEYQSSIILVPGKTENTHGKYNETNFNYNNPFSGR